MISEAHIHINSSFIRNIVYFVYILHPKKAAEFLILQTCKKIQTLLVSRPLHGLKMIHYIWICSADVIIDDL